MASRSDSRLLSLGKRAWAVLGVLGVVLAALYTAQQVRVVVVAFVLALFPAALMTPAADRLRRTRAPNALSAALLVVLLLLAFVVPVWVVVPLFAAQVPDLVDALVRGLERLEAAVDWTALPGSAQGPGDLAERAFEAAGSRDVLDQGLAAAATVLHTLTGLILMIVVLFFCLKDGRRLWQGVLDLLPAHHHEQVDRLARQAWWTLGAYLRGQLLVALFDAVFIGLGLWLLDVPLALPLAVVVFFGGLFPIVGAFVSGLVAVLVALADQGLVTAVLTLALIVVVQQVEGNVLEPLILSNIVALHPLLIILAITGGALLLGILGAFVAVPIAAIVARVVDHVRGRAPAAGYSPT